MGESTHWTSLTTPRVPPKARILRTSADTSKTVPRLCLNEVCSSRNGSSGGIFKLAMPFPNFGIISFIASLMHSSRCGLSIWHVIVPDAVKRERNYFSGFILSQIQNSIVVFFQFCGRILLHTVSNLERWEINILWNNCIKLCCSMVIVDLGNTCEQRKKKSVLLQSSSRSVSI